MSAESMTYLEALHVLSEFELSPNARCQILQISPPFQSEKQTIPSIAQERLQVMAGMRDTLRESSVAEGDIQRFFTTEQTMLDNVVPLDRILTGDGHVLLQKLQKKTLFHLINVSREEILRRVHEYVSSHPMDPVDDDTQKWSMEGGNVWIGPADSNPFDENGRSPRIGSFTDTY